MPGIIYLLDGWKPFDDHTKKDLAKEQRERLRHKIGEDAWNYLQAEEQMRKHDEKTTRQTD